MCGICGLVDPGASSAGALATVGSMMESLEHRGPDGGGSWQAGPATLGHRRLAIIDLEGGRQPLTNEQGDVAVVFNGEIYNYRELRAVLAGKGHDFRTASDTEVLVHGYEEWGDRFVEHMRGMFAFGIWDGRAGRARLLLGRDRLGVKSLYYHLSASGRIAFASEIKALLAVPDVPRALNAPKVPEYLMFRTVSGEETLFDGIRELEPGRLMALEDGRVTQSRYWAPQAAATTAPHGDVSARGADLLEDAVRARLVSDVPLGTVTSGGLDSSLVSAIAARLTGRPIDTFCVGFADPSYDERPWGRQVAERIGSRHHEIEVGPAQIDAEMDRLTWAHDEPLSHPNSVPMHLIFRYAKEEAGVTVLLSGEGADEVFGGYEWYPVAHRRARLQRIPGLGRIAALVPIAKAATLARVLSPDYLQQANALTPPGAVARLMGGPVRLPADRSGLLGGDRPDHLFPYDQQTYLLPLLQRQDRMSMAAGLEARVPFLDHFLVEWANALPAATKLPGGRAKGLLKDIAGKWLPESVIHRRKVGFAMPLGAWLRSGGALHHRVQLLLDHDSPLHGVVDPSALATLAGEHASGAADHTDLLWSMVALRTWADVFLGPQVGATRLPGAGTGRLTVPQ